MVDSNANLWGFPPIGSSQLWPSSIQDIKNMRKPDVPMFDNAPNDITVWMFFWKVGLCFMVWACVAVLLFATLSAFWWLTAPEEGKNTIIGVLLPVVGFVVGFVGNLALALLYNIFYSNRYYSFGKMAGLIFASLIICLLFFVPYFLYMENTTVLYTILGFQLIFQLFIAKNLIDFLSQPNYSASSLMWNTLWIVLAILAHIVIISIITVENIVPVTASSVIAYVMIAVWSWLWDAVYYKFYEWWSNPFYLPSLNELREERRKEEVKKAKENEEINVDME